MTSSSYNTGTPYVSGQQYAADNATDVLMNGTVTSGHTLNFHIKNISPFNNQDVFLSLQKAGDSTLFNTFDPAFISGLYGQNVDTVVSHYERDDNSLYIFRYSFTKNSMTTVKFDTVHTDCNSLTNVDVFY